MPLTKGGSEERITFDELPTPSPTTRHQPHKPFPVSLQDTETGSGSNEHPFELGGSLAAGENTRLLRGRLSQPNCMEDDERNDPMVTQGSELERITFDKLPTPPFTTRHQHSHRPFPVLLAHLKDSVADSERESSNEHPFESEGSPAGEKTRQPEERSPYPKNIQPNGLYLLIIISQ